MRLEAVPRLLRYQFTPIMIAPVALGAAAAWHFASSFSPVLFLLVLAGSVSLHLAANGIDDVYDFVNGTDKIAEDIFPKEAPGWKPIPRGLMSVGDAFKVSYLFYGFSLAVGLILSVVVGWFALAIAVPGILLSYFYTAPPLRLDYRGLGLGELSILLSFGPIPALGSYYVMSGQLSLIPVLLGIPSGVLTVAILMRHDQIFYDVYKQAGKKSLAVVLGRRKTSVFASGMSVIAFGLLAVYVGMGMVPIACALGLGAVAIFYTAKEFGRRELTPPEYGNVTQRAFLVSTSFTLLFALGLALG